MNILQSLATLDEQQIKRLMLLVGNGGGKPKTFSGIKKGGLKGSGKGKKILVKRSSPHKGGVRVWATNSQRYVLKDTGYLVESVPDIAIDNVDWTTRGIEGLIQFKQGSKIPFIQVMKKREGKSTFDWDKVPKLSELDWNEVPVPRKKTPNLRVDVHRKRAKGSPEKVVKPIRTRLIDYLISSL